MADERSALITIGGNEYEKLSLAVAYTCSLVATLVGDVPV